LFSARGIAFGQEDGDSTVVSGGCQNNTPGLVVLCGFCVFFSSFRLVCLLRISSAFWNFEAANLISWTKFRTFGFLPKIESRADEVKEGTYGALPACVVSRLVHKDIFSRGMCMYVREAMDIPKSDIF
jgi:hypothetical protein